MRTSKEWWADLLGNGPLLLDWLTKQYHGEVLAGVRIRKVFSEFELTPKEGRAIEQIATEEDLHAKWIGGLLEARGVKPKVLGAHKERYWKETLTDISDKANAAAVGYLAEDMRLERIRAIVESKDSPKDIASVMKRILRQEVKHASIFKSLSTPELIAAHKGSHHRGRELLGLVS